MATGIQDGLRKRLFIALTCVTITLTGTASAVRAEDDPKTADDQAISKKLIDDIAKQMEKFCKAKSVSTVQVVGFKGSIGTQSEADVKRQWLDTLKEHGIGMREVDSTRLSGCLMTQVSGDDSLVLLTCTLTDNRGAEICTFRVRKVIPTKSINQASPVVAQVTQ